MTNPRFHRTARVNRFKAFCFTFFFHAMLIGGLYYTSGSDASPQDLLPEFVKEWFDSGEEKAPVEEKEPQKKRNRA